MARVEADHDTAANLRARGLRTVTNLDEVRGPVDTVLAIEVIEHLDDPVAVLTRLAGLLRQVPKVASVQVSGVSPDAQAVQLRVRARLSVSARLTSL